MTERPIDVLFIGTCVDQGTDLASGQSLVAVAQESIRRRLPGVPIRFGQELLVHLAFLPKAVDRALESGAEVVMIGLSETDTAGPTRVNRLWALDPDVAQRVLAASRRIRAAFRGASVSGVGSERRGVLEDTAFTEVLRVTIPALSAEAYERVLGEQVERLLRARVRVILRASPAMTSRLGGLDDRGAESAVERVARRHGISVVWPWECLSGPIDDYVDVANPDKVLRGGMPVWLPNERAHREIAAGLDASVGAAVQEVVDDRVAGRPGVLARVDRKARRLTIS